MTKPPPFDANQAEESGWLEDLRLVKRTLEENEAASREFAKRVEAVSRILAARNARLGHPLPDQELPDLAQDVLMLIWRKLPSFRGNASLETWFYRICSLELMNAIRRVQRKASQRASADEARVEPTAPASQRPESGIRFDDLHRALDGLEAAEAQVVRLKHFDELTFLQIGRRLGITTSLAKARYYRALKALRFALRHDETEEAQAT